MPNIVYPSDLACEALGVELSNNTSITAPDDGRCAMCNKPHKAGDAVDLMEMGKSFTLNLQISNPTSPYRCTACSHIVSSQDYLKKLGGGVIFEEGFFPCLSKKDRGYWLLHPPKPPFIFNIQVSKSQHMVWRSVVNYSQEVIFIRLGEDILKARTAKLKEGKKANQALLDAQQKAVTEKLTKKKPTRTAFSFSDTRGQRLNQSEFYNWVYDIVEIYPDSQQHVDKLMTLTANEMYLLDFILDDKYTKPEPIRTKLA